MRLVAVALVATIPHFVSAQTISGTIADSSSAKAVSHARIALAGTALQATTDSLGRFTIAGAPSGEQVLVIHTPSLDSLNAGYSAPVTVAAGTTTLAVRVPNALQIASTSCGDRWTDSGGIVIGRLRVAEDSAAPLAGTVSAEWKSAGGADSNRWVSATSDTRGRFALCGVALDAPLTIRGVTDNASGQLSNARVSLAARFNRVEVVLHRGVATAATFAGLVTDSSNKPIAAVEVQLADAGQGALTNEQGAFVLRDVPAGPQHVLARHVGYGPVESQLTFVAGQTIQRHITMTRSTTLDSVVVTEKSVDHQLDDFNENKKVGLGHFLTRAQLATQEGRSTSSVLISLPGIKVSTVGPYAWVGSGRKTVTTLQGGGAVASLDPSDAAKRAPLWDCYALVYLDDHLVFRGQKFVTQGRLSSGYEWEPLFDINSIAVSEIEAIEYYASPAQTPLKYSVLNSQCGVLVIHTIRFHPRDTTAVTKNP